MSSGIPFKVALVTGSAANYDLMTIGGTAVTGSVPTATITATVTTQGGIPDYVVTAGSVTFTLSETSGARIMLTATAGASGATITGLRMRGNLVSVVRRHEVTYPEDITDIPAGKILRLSSREEISLETAREHVFGVYLHHSVPHATVVFTVITSMYDATTNDALYQREISDMITIVEAQTGINADYHIEQIRQSTQGVLLVTEYGCEEVVVL